MNRIIFIFTICFLILSCNTQEKILKNYFNKLGIKPLTVENIDRQIAYPTIQVYNSQAYKINELVETYLLTYGKEWHKSVVGSNIIYQQGEKGSVIAVQPIQGKTKIAYRINFTAPSSDSVFLSSSNDTIKIIIGALHIKARDDFFANISSQVIYNRDAIRNEKYTFYSPQSDDTYQDYIKDFSVNNSNANFEYISEDKEAWLAAVNKMVKQDIKNNDARLGVIVEGKLNQATYVLSEIQRYIANNNSDLTIIPASAQEVKNNMKQIELQQTGLYNEGYTVKTGEMIGAQYLLVGMLYQLGNKNYYELHCKITSIERGKYLSGGIKVLINNKYLPK